MELELGIYGFSCKKSNGGDLEPVGVVLPAVHVGPGPIGLAVKCGIHESNSPDPGLYVRVRFRGCGLCIHRTV